MADEENSENIDWQKEYTHLRKVGQKALTEMRNEYLKFSDEVGDLIEYSRALEVIHDEISSVCLETIRRAYEKYHIHLLTPEFIKIADLVLDDVWSDAIVPKHVLVYDPDLYHPSTPDCADCGHSYDRHFDLGDADAPAVGCKYCSCQWWNDPRVSS